MCGIQSHHAYVFVSTVTVCDDSPISKPLEDVRRLRTRRRLAEVILQLAGEQSITTATVHAVTRRAGINRSTFYAHASNPMQLLSDTLSAELDEVHRSAMEEIEKDGRLYREETRMVMNQLLDHIVQHEAIYAGPSKSSALFALRVVLAEHVERSLLQVLGEGFTAAPMHSGAHLALYAGFLSHGVAGAIEAWLQLPFPRDRELLLDAIEAMYPGWYAPSIESRVAKQASREP